MSQKKKDLQLDQQKVMAGKSSIKNMFSKKSKEENA